jgi:hypothetical protein
MRNWVRGKRGGGSRPVFNSTAGCGSKATQIEQALADQRARHKLQQEEHDKKREGEPKSARNEETTAPAQLDIWGYQYDSVTDRYYKSGANTKATNNRNCSNNNNNNNNNNSNNNNNNNSSSSSSSSSNSSNPPVKKTKTQDTNRLSYPSLGNSNSLDSSPILNNNSKSRNDNLNNSGNIHLDLIRNFSRTFFEKFVALKLEIEHDEIYFSTRKVRQNRSCHLSHHPDYGIASFMMQDRELGFRKSKISVADILTNNDAAFQHPILRRDDIDAKGISWRPRSASSGTIATLAICGNSQHGSHVGFLNPSFCNESSSLVDHASLATAIHDLNGYYFSDLEWSANGDNLFLLGGGDIWEVRVDHDMHHYRIKLPINSKSEKYSTANVASQMMTTRSSPNLRAIGMRNGNISLYDCRSNRHSILSNSLIDRQRNTWLAVDHLSVLRDEFSIVAQDITGKIICLDSRFPKSEVGVICNGFDNNRIRRRNFWISPCEGYLCTSYESERSKYDIGMNDCCLALFPIKGNYSHHDDANEAKNSKYFGGSSGPGYSPCKVDGPNPMRTISLPFAIESSSKQNSSSTSHYMSSHSSKFVCKSWIQLEGNNNYSGANYENLSSVHIQDPFIGLVGAVNFEDEKGSLVVQTLVQGSC